MKSAIADVGSGSGSGRLSSLLIGVVSSGNGGGDSSATTIGVDESYKARLANLVASNLSRAALSPDAPNTCLVYDDLPCECGSDGKLLGSAAAYLLKWSKVAIKKTANAYLSSPVLLALLPLLLGLVLGFALAHWWFRDVRSSESKGRRKARKSRFALSSWIDALIISMATSCVADAIQRCVRWAHTKMTATNSNNDDDGHVARKELAHREGTVRQHLSSEVDTDRESGIPLSRVPKHIAVIMDGNRRYGRKTYGSVTRGHWDGSKTLADFAKWCIAEGVQVLTVYAFSTENWDRDPEEVAALMAIFVRYCDELREEALVRGIRLRVLSTETDRIPQDVASGLKRMVHETAHCDKFLMNICLSYGSRGEIVNACRSVASDVHEGALKVQDITPDVIEDRLLTRNCPDPDILLRTSGEMRISNFLLWQASYSEIFFVEKTWPELTKKDLVEVIQDFAEGRQRRFGK